MAFRWHRQENVASYGVHRVFKHGKAEVNCSFSTFDFQFSFSLICVSAATVNLLVWPLLLVLRSGCSAHSLRRDYRAQVLSLSCVSGNTPEDSTALSRFRSDSAGKVH